MMEGKWKKGLAVVSGIGVLGLLLAGCGTTGGNNATTNANPPAATGKPVVGGNIVIEESQGWKDLDPALAYDTQSYEVVQQMYDQLVTYKTGANVTDLTGMVAKTWDVSPDGKTYTFHLRNDVKFWNGDPVTAQSFIDEIQRVATKSLGSGGEGFIEVIQGEKAFNAGTAKTISGLSAPDPYTLQIKLTQPSATFAYVLAMPFFSAVDQSFINKVGLKPFDSTQAMGSGPFELGSVNANQFVLKKNPNYWRTDSNGTHLPYLDQVTIRINQDNQLIGLDFEKGQTAFLGMNQNIPTQSFPHFVSTPALSKLIVKQTQVAVYYLGMNVNMAPFNNPLVRQAVEYAIDKNKILKLVNGRGIIANQPLPPALPGYVQNLPADATYNYDPAKAKALLAQAGIKPGTPITLYGNNDADNLKIEEAQQADLEAIGFKVTLKSTTWGAFLDVAEKGQAQIFDLGWFQDYPDAGDFMMLFQTDQAPVNNSTMYSNKQVDQWLATAASSQDQNQRVQLFQQATVQVMKDAPWVPLYYPIANMAVQPWVHGWFTPAAMEDPLEMVWIDPGHSQS